MSDQYDIYNNNILIVTLLSLNQNSISLSYSVINIGVISEINLEFSAIIKDCYSK